MGFEWTETDDLAVRTAKALAADAVENAGSGHPGTAISMAPAAYLVFQRHLNFDPAEPKWLGRDRFVLSMGHSSLLHYIQLFLAGEGIEKSDVESYRKFGSLMPGHPERGHTDGIEVTTGPLGTGLGAAVGMAMDARRVRGMFDPDAEAGTSPFDHYVYVMAGDGCMQEGVATEAASLAGTQELGNLIVIYDKNDITIEDDTSIAFTEDVVGRYQAQGWHTQQVNWVQPDGSYKEDLEALDAALVAARANTSQPSLICVHSIIGWPSPKKMNTGAIHGAKLGGEELAALKEALGLDKEATFQVDEQMLATVRQNTKQRAAAARENWDPKFAAWQEKNPQKAEELAALLRGQVPDLSGVLPAFDDGKPIATRAASGKVLSAIGPHFPALWGGSADLAGSNNTTIAGEKSFLPASRTSKAWEGDPYGRVLHFGVREHGMAAIMNGMAAGDITRPFGGTFLVFSDFMRGSVRLSALMNLPVTYVWSHDSIGVGEDGPTHQPVETLAALRAIPNFAVVRPADAQETAQAWRFILEKSGPAGIILTRQNLPNPVRDEASGLAGAQNLEKGAYVLKDCEGTPDVLLLASGSEVQHALGAQEILAKESIKARVVSVPCVEWFEAQPQSYQDEVLPPQVAARVSVEAGVAMPWYKYLGTFGKPVSIESFGEPGPADTLFEKFGFTAENVAQKAKESLAAYREFHK